MNGYEKRARPVKNSNAKLDVYVDILPLNLLGLVGIFNDKIPI